MPSSQFHPFFSRAASATILLGVLLLGEARGQIVINAGTTLVPNPAAATLPALTDPAGILISGTGQLRVTGAGTYTFGGSAAQPFILNGGSATGAFRTQGVSTTVNNSFQIAGNSVLFVQGGANTMTLNGNLSGNATLTKLGGGTLDLKRANPNFTGGVVIENGAIALSHLDALAKAGSVIVRGDDLQLNVRGLNEWRIGTGAIVLDGGRLRQFDGGENDIAIISQTIRLTSKGGNLGAPGDSRMYVDGEIVGAGSLTKSGGGELRFRGTEKRYTGQTFVNNGRLRIDDDGLPTRTSAIVLNGGNLRFGQRKTRTYSLGARGRAPVSIAAGGGSIEYTDEIGAILTNSVSVDGPGNFRSRIAGSVFEFTGALKGSGTLTINEGSTNNPVQGGTIYLTGNASRFAGDVEVVQSTLRLGERTTLGAKQFTLLPDGILALDIASTTRLGRVAAQTSFLTAGSRIAPVFSGGLAPGENRIRILSGNVSDDGVSLLRENVGVARFGTEVVPGGLDLVAKVDYRGFGLGLNRIQRAVGDYLNASNGAGGVSAIRGYALNLESQPEIAKFYDAVAAEEIGGMMDTAIYHAQDQLRSITRNAPHVQGRLGLADHRGLGPAAGGSNSGGKSVQGGKTPLGAKSPISSEAPEWSLFTDVSVHRGTRTREYELGGFDDSGSGFVLGADRLFSDRFGAGFFGVYEHAHSQFDASRGWAKSDTAGVGAMASWLGDRSLVTAGIQHLHHSFEMERYSPVGTARSKPDGNQLGLIVEGSTQVGRGAFSLVPSAFLQYNRLWIDGFEESGGAIAQRFDDLDGDSLQAGVGLRAGYTIPGRGFALRPEVFAEYRHELVDADRAIASSFPGASGTLRFETPGREPGYAVVGGALHAAFSHSASAFVQYEAQLIDSDTYNYGVYGGFRWHFPDNLLASPDLVFADQGKPFRESLRGTPLGEAMNFINLRALVALQYDHFETANEGGTEADPDDPDATDFWFARRVRLSADRDLPWGFNVGASWQFAEDLDSDLSAAELFSTTAGWDLFEPFTLKAGLDKVPLGWEESTGSATLKTIERSVATRALGRLGGDEIGRSKWLASASGRFRELYTSHTGPVERYDFHYEFAAANPREGYDAAWSDDPTGTLDRWPEQSLYLRVQNELRTVWGTFDFGADFADIPTFRARSEDQITGAEAFSPFLNYSLGGFNLTGIWSSVEYRRDEENGGELRRPSGFTVIPSYFITPQVELVGMYSRFDTDGDFAVRLNQAARNVPTSYPENRRYDDIEQLYFGINHYLKGDDLKVMYGIEHLNASGTRADREVGGEDAWGFRVRVQLRL